MDDPDIDWLGELHWHGYPHLQPLRDVASAPPSAAAGAPRPAAVEPAAEADPRLGRLAQENEALRAKLETLTRLASEFESRLSEAAASYEGTMLELESRLRDAALEREHLAGELESAKAEGARLSARDAAREHELRLERERRADAEKALLEAKRRLEELTLETERERAEAAERGGALQELRRQATAQNERVLQAKALTDEDIRLLRLEMREFLAKFHRIQDTFGDKT